MVFFMILHHLTYNFQSMLPVAMFLIFTDFCEWIIKWTDTGEFSRDEKMVYAIQQREMIGPFSTVSEIVYSLTGIK